MYELYKLIDAYSNYQHPRKYNQDPAGFATLRGEFLCMSSPALGSVIEARPEKKLCSTHTHRGWYLLSEYGIEKTRDYPLLPVKI